MTASQNHRHHPIRPRTFQDDLLQDLRHAAPVTDGPSSGSRARVKEMPGAGPRETAPTVEVRVTPTRWLAPSVRQAAGGQRMVLSAGPLSVSVDLFRR
jgi:hypothetical protein